jgi:soluble lytic murein transglycosylase-like protein
MIQRTIPRLFTALIFLACSTAGAAAWGNASNYVHVRRSVQQVLLPATMLGALQQEPANYIGQAAEIKATVTGLVIAGTNKTALLSVGDDSVCVTMPPKLKDSLCVESGNTIRVLVAVKADKTIAAGASLVMIAVAPDSEVVQAERTATTAATTTAEPSRRGSLPSRSMAYGMSRADAVALANATPTAEYDDSRAEPITALSGRAKAVYGTYRTFVRSMNRGLSEDEVDKIATSILYYSDIEQIDPRLVVAMIIAESGFDPNSTSNVGAMGLGQLMPSTADGLNVSDPYDPVQNIAASVHILRGNLDKYGGAPANAGTIPVNQIKLVMAAYNAGPGAVRKYHGVPPYRETQRYVVKVASLYQQLCGATR